MLSFFKKPSSRPAIFFYNSLSKTKEEFKPLSDRRVKMYTCGPTVYDYAHIGNLRTYVFADLVRRTLEYGGYEVKQIMNITDVGHLSSDGDEGEDKMTSALKREGKELTLENMKVLAENYAAFFIEDLKTLDIEIPFALPRASEHIPEQIAFISTLLQKGYAYKISDGVYFDTAKFPKYGILGGSASTEHSRVGAHPEKHDQRDFALWKFNTALGWDAPWGKGFPGWHIECAAMATKYLGTQFDIHTGGIDLAPIHHNNEIAEAEAASGKMLATYWMHGAFVAIEKKRIGKSEGNAVRLYQLREHGIVPLAYRYLLLTAHYRQTMNFTWEAVEAAQTALQKVQRIFADLPSDGLLSVEYRAKFEAAINDDLDMPRAIALMWELLKDDSISPEMKQATLLDFDRVFGFGLGAALSSSAAEKLVVVLINDLPAEIETLVAERETARVEKNWPRADELRTAIQEKGFVLEDGPQGLLIRKVTGTEDSDTAD